MLNVGKPTHVAVGSLLTRKTLAEEYEYTTVTHVKLLIRCHIAFLDFGEIQDNNLHALHG